jgi:uncharacterized protein (DUF1800 family)
VRKVVFWVLPVLIILSSFLLEIPKLEKTIIENEDSFIFPYLSQELTKREATSHLINRFTYGATPGMVDEVMKIGLEKWFLNQLEGNNKEDLLNEHLSKFQFLNLTNDEVSKMFPKPIQLLRMASADGIIPKDSINLIGKDETKERLKDYVASKNIHQQGELTREFVNQRIIRARYAKNQLTEVLTGFWFNHFNVSLTKPQLNLLAPAYERDVIRPNITGKFKDLLSATAHSPAMLYYLDNFISSSTIENSENKMADSRIGRYLESKIEETDSISKASIRKLKNNRRNKGLNENYARELMELHTLGVDGGYTQKDVTEAARVLSGWSIYPFEDSYAPGVRKLIEKIGDEKLSENGYVHQGDFLFAMNRHDIKAKNLLGKDFPSGNGYSEGMALLDLLAHHPSTSVFISRKLATYFVADNPPQSLVDRMAKTFREKDGDIKLVLMTMVMSKEFWSVASVRQKTKSPFEFVISVTRALNADINAPFQLFQKMERMGQKIYYFQAPTGFPDNATYWINTGSLLNRMNFGLDIAANQIRGTRCDLLQLNKNHEPENANAALITFSSILLPERNQENTIKRLSPLLTTPDFKERIFGAIDAKQKKNQPEMMTSMETDTTMMLSEEIEIKEVKNINQEENVKKMLAQVVGIIIGSPEFQRR